MLKGKWRRTIPWGLVLAIVLGLAARAWYYFDLSGHPSFNHPIVDAASFDRMALQILEGGPRGVFFRPPGYSYFLAFNYALAGHNQAPVVWFQFLLGITVLFPTYFLARRWFCRKTADLAVLALAAYPLRIYFEGELLDVTLFSTLFIWSVWFLWRGLETSSSAFHFVSGILWGLAAIIRPSILPVIPFVLLAWFVVGGHRLAKRWTSLLVLVAAMVLPTLPVARHNWRAERAIIPVATYGGINFYLGNRQGASGFTPLPPGLEWHDTVQIPYREGISTHHGLERYWWKKAGEAIRADPAAWLGLLFRKVAIFLNAYESGNNKDLAFFTEVSFPTRHYRWWFGAAICTAIPAMLLSMKGTSTRFAGLILGGYGISIAMVFVTARYRMPIVPLLVIFGAAGIVTWVESIRHATSWRSVLFPALVVALGIASFPPWFTSSDKRINPDLQMGEIYLDSGEYHKALELLMRAAQADPDNPNVHDALGTTYFHLRDFHRSRNSFLEALKHGRFSNVYYNLGTLYDAQGEPFLGLALDNYRTALTLNPLDRRARDRIKALENSSR